MNVAISGGGFTGKGAEAMLRTVRTELARRIGGLECSLWRCPPTQSRQALDAGFSLMFWPGDRPGISARAQKKLGIDLTAWSTKELSVRTFPVALGGGASRQKMLSAAYCHYLERTGRAIDAVIDIGGFAYGDEWSLGRALWNAPLIEFCTRHAVPMIYLPQAWGSFEKPDIRQGTRQLLETPVTWLYSRDEQSSRYLEELLGRPDHSIAAWPDIAFAFRGGTREQGQQILRSMGCDLTRQIVGVAPNMQIYRRVDGSGLGNLYVRSLVRVVEHCLEEHDVDIVLQASEMYASGSAIDDRHLCSLIAAAVDRPDRCFATQDVLTAGQSAALISCFDYLVGSRFHSLVFGLSQGVPGMAVSWSHKYRQLLAPFGLEDSVIELDRLESEALITTFEQGWGRRAELQPQILATAQELRLQVGALFDEVAAVVGGHGRSSG